VEEEFLLVDADSRRVVPRGEEVAVAARAVCGEAQVTVEMDPAQVEANSAVCTDMAELRVELMRLRGGLARTARRHGCRLVAGGTVPLGASGPPPVTDVPRYQRIHERFAALLHQQCTCGCHVHIGVPDREEAVRVSNHLRPWLPHLLALSANSPFWAGHDTGYASWRTLLWGRWPCAGVPPYFTSAAHYDDVVAGLKETGMVLDEGMLYWYVRPSHRLPTVEIRVADVSPTADGAVLLAALSRALVATALELVRAGEPAPAVPDALVRGACWRAAHDGVTGQGVDLHADAGSRLVPFWDQSARLLRYVWPALVAAGDAELVTSLLADVRVRGNGAQRQRSAYQRRHRLEDVVDLLGDLTEHGTAAWRDDLLPVPTR
jgi:carboxylate-amine ligase